MRFPRLAALCTLWSIGSAALAGPLPARVLDGIPLHVLSTDALQRVRASLPPAGSRGPTRLALSVPMPLDLADGTWTESDGVAIWRTRVYSAGATLLIAAFDRFDLPEGAELRFSDAAGTTVQGPYTAHDRNADGGLWTALVPGEDGLIELRVPVAARDQIALHLALLGHGEAELRDGGIRAKSGSCNVDVACAAGDAWRTEIRSVVRLQIPSSTPGFVTLCTGQLVNNSLQDDKPYVLTANHCGITASSAAGVVAYFNFQTSTCGGSPNGSLTQNQTGARRVFADARSDHTLLELTAAPRAEYNAHLSGFDASASAVPQSGVSIHHPNGDEKRISTFSSPAPRNNGVCLGNFVAGTGICDGTIIDTFRVSWSSGVTEQGSSGGGLWNQNDRLVGVLSGGNSSCASPSSNDFYGRLDLAWSNGLAAYLDPLGGTNRSVAGRDLGTAVSPGSGGSGTGTSGGGSSSSGGGGGGSFGGAAWLLAIGLMRLSARRACRVAARA